MAITRWPVASWMSPGSFSRVSLLSPHMPRRPLAVESRNMPSPIVNDAQNPIAASSSHGISSHGISPTNPVAASSSYGISPSNLGSILEGPWLLSEEEASPKLTSVLVDADGMPVRTEASSKGSFLVIRDDLLHPVSSGNKLRKLDAVMPLLHASGVTHVVTCGGVQSAHTAAVAATCAEHGMEAHLILRGEAPRVPTGHCLMSHMFGFPHYATRTEYADRGKLLGKWARRVAGEGGEVCTVDQLATAGREGAPVGREESAAGGDITAGRERTAGREGSAAGRDITAGREGAAVWQEGGIGRRVAILEEGGSSHIALLGFVRLIRQLAREYPHLQDQECVLVVDSGTGATAVGCAAGIALLKLPWRVVGVMLAGPEEYYKQQEHRLWADFCAHHDIPQRLEGGCEFGRSLESAASETEMGQKDLEGDGASLGSGTGKGRAAALAAVLESGTGDVPAVLDPLEHLTQAEGISVRLPLSWVERRRPRRFGKVFPGEVKKCMAVARLSGILVDPIYTLSAWEMASLKATSSCGQEICGEGRPEVLLLHTGGGLGLMGLAQRSGNEFLEPQ